MTLSVAARRDPWATPVTVEIGDAGDNPVIAAPGNGLRLVVASLMVQNTTATATTVTIQWGTTTVATALLGERERYEFESTPGREWLLPAG